MKITVDRDAPVGPGPGKSIMVIVVWLIFDLLESVVILVELLHQSSSSLGVCEHRRQGRPDLTG